MIRRIFMKVKLFYFLLYYSKKFNYFSSKSYIDDPIKLQGLQYATVEENSYIHKFAWIGCYKIPKGNDPVLKIGRGVSIGNFCHISCVSSILIEDKVLIADKVTIADSSHQYTNIKVPIIEQSFCFLRKVIIGEGSWVADNCSILGAKIGKHCVIGAGSVVTKDIPDYSVAVGNPAKVVKRYSFKTKKWERIVG